MNTSPVAGSRFLDAAVVLFALGNVTLFGAALTFRDIPQANLPILASLGTAVLGVVTAYAVWRFKSPSKPEPGTVTLTPPISATVDPPSGGSAITPPAPQAVTVTHVFSPDASYPGPPPPPPPPPSSL